MSNERVSVKWDFSSLPKFAESEARYAIGISHSQGEPLLRAALVRALGRGRDMVCDTIDFAKVDIDARCVSFLSELVDPAQVDFSDFIFWKSELAETAAALVQPLISRGRRDFQEPLVIGVHDVGIWTEETDGHRKYQPVCDANLLAERTGITVVDDFPGKDLANGGRGGPITAMADWILFGERSAIPGQRNKIILHIGPTLRICVIPSRTSGSQTPGISAFDVGIGTSLIEEIRSRLGKSGARFNSVEAAQSLGNNDIVDHWLSMRCPRKWSPLRYPVQGFVDHLAATDGLRTDAGALFATVMSFLAAQVSEGLSALGPKSMPSRELILVGEYAGDGYLQNRLRHYLRDVDVSSAGISLDHADSACAGILALMRVDNESSTSMQQTGALKPRAFGRFTPGRPVNWLIVGGETKQGHMTLKSAV